MEKPLLSICIPTYNRANYLEKCLKAIVNQEGFDERVEVVISDNCSVDKTQTVAKKYTNRYSNIHYYRNDENIVAKNQVLVLQKASGLLRKLTNDTVIYKPGAIKYMLQAVEDNLEKRPQLFFLNSQKLNKDPLHVDTLELYVKTLGHMLTWIASVAVWVDDCDNLYIFDENADTLLGQVPFLLKNFEKHGAAVIYDRVIIHGLVPKNKNVSYGIYHVFYENFLGFIMEYVQSNKISMECYDAVRKRLLMEFFLHWVVEKEVKFDKFIFSDENLRGLVEEAYKDEEYFEEYQHKLSETLKKNRIKKFRHKVKAKFKNIFGRL